MEIPYKITIKKDAKLKEIIVLLNEMQLSCSQKTYKKLKKCPGIKLQKIKLIINNN